MVLFIPGALLPSAAPDYRRRGGRGAARAAFFFVFLFSSGDGGSRRTLVWAPRRRRAQRVSGTGSSPTHGIERSAVGGRVTFSLPIPAREADPARSVSGATRTRRRRGAVAAVAMAGWFSLSLGALLPSAAPDYRRRRRFEPRRPSYVLFRLIFFNLAADGGSRRTLVWALRRRRAQRVSGTGSSPTHGIERSAVGAPARPLSPTSRAKSAASRPTRTRRLAGRCGCWPMSPWSLYPLARGCRAPRRIMPELEATAPAIRATRSSRLDGAAAAGRTMVRSTSAAVAGFV